MSSSTVRGWGGLSQQVCSSPFWCDVVCDVMWCGVVWCGVAELEKQVKEHQGGTKATGQANRLDASSSCTPASVARKGVGDRSISAVVECD